jgi:hypothetical protein
MRRIKWIVKRWREIWNWAGVYTRFSGAGVKNLKYALPDYVEFEVPGMVEPYDRMRLIAGNMVSCGTARMGMSLHVCVKEWGGWTGGVIDHRDLIAIRDLINAHLSLIEKLSPEERHRLEGTISERLNGRNEEWAEVIEENCR